MSVDIVFKVRNFPHISETFVVSNIAEAIKQGYRVKIIADHINAIHHGSQTELINKYEIMALVSAVTPPKAKYLRVFKSVFYCLNPIILFYFIKYCMFKNKVSLSYVFILIFYQQFKQAKIFHIHFPNTAENISVLKQIGFLKSKIITTFHGFDAYFSNDKEKKRLVEDYSKFYALWNKITVNTPYLKDIVLRLQCPKSKISIVPMAINLDFYRPTNHPKKIEKDSAIHILSIGRLISLKGHKYGIEAVKLLVDKGYNVHYTILGNGVEYENLSKRIKTLKLENIVTLYGKANQLQVKEMLEIAHVFLMTSVADDNGREETQGVVTAEAQAMGLPVVGFKSGGVPYTVTDDTAILVNQKNSKALAEGLLTMINNPNYPEISKAAKVWAMSQFGLSKMMTSFYNDLI